MKLAKIFFTFLLIVTTQLEARCEIETSTVVDADEIEYVTDKELVVAKGNVEIFKNDYLLKADRVIYNKTNNKVFAIGNVFILDPDGDEVFADQIEINRQLKEAIIDDFKIRMAENSLFTANHGHYVYPDNAQLDNAVYSPCPICGDNTYPQWQLAAKYVDIDKKAERVTYKHGFFELFGKPIFYTPYFSHPTPNAKPKSGFLTPRMRYTTSFGQGVMAPYYFRIADDRDLTFAPIFTSKQGIVYTAKYQQRTRSGFYTVRSSYNKSKTKSIVEPDNRFYLNVEGNTKISDKWYFDTNLQRTSDKSYLRNYFGDNQNYLTSQANFIYSHKRDHAVINSLYFQELRPTINQDEVPVILPVVDFHKEFAGENNNRYALDNNLLLLSRKQGSETRRISSTASWTKTYFTKDGHLFSLYRRLRGDAYNFAHKRSAAIQRDQINNSPNNVGRIIPEIEGKWQLPLIKSNHNADMFLEPVSNIILSPNMPTTSKVINEDSQEVEITDENLFLADRYAGFDRVENGLRGAYGLNGYYRTSSDITYGMLVGQAYRARTDRNYTVDSGLRTRLSDVVGRLSARPWQILELSYRFRYDPRDKQMRKNEVRSDINYNPWNFSLGLVDYNFIQALSEDQVKKSIDLGMGLKLSHEWVLNAGVKQNYTKNQKFLVSSEGSIGYNGACVTTLFKIKKDYTHDLARNFKKNLSFALEIHLKNIN